MADPKICAKAPITVDLEKGKEYCFCPCGLSKKQPFCDGSHKVEGNFKSLHFFAEKDGPATLCMCKHSQNMPYCDGSHSKIA